RRHVGGDQVAQLAHQLGAFGRGQAGPFRERFLRRGNRRVHFGFAAGGDLGQHFLRGRVDGGEIVLAGNALAGDQVVDSHAAMVCTWAPLPSISVTTTSPTCQSTTPSGVPVRIRSPGASVMKLEEYSMRKGTSKIMSFVLPDCVTWPLTVVRSASAIGSG